MAETDESFKTTSILLDNQSRCRPARNVRKPRIFGPQTAIVVGPSGDEIYTDKYGRVKVQFDGDRPGHRDEKLSFWIRVAFRTARPGDWPGRHRGWYLCTRYAHRLGTKKRFRGRVESKSAESGWQIRQCDQ
jgi:type VI secretion system secreted protein VgrG